MLTLRVACAKRSGRDVFPTFFVAGNAWGLPVSPGVVLYGVMVLTIHMFFRRKFGANISIPALMSIVDMACP